MYNMIKRKKTTDRKSAKKREREIEKEEKIRISREY